VLKGQHLALVLVQALVQVLVQVLQLQALVLMQL
jgi:hypothetical protein